MNDSKDSSKGAGTELSELTTHGPGRAQELERKFSLLSICGIALTTGESWVALGSGIVVAIYNLGPRGVIFGLLAASFFYWFIAASIAELASAMPSSGTVYHWASVTGGKRYGRICGWFAGWWNFLAWTTATASLGFFMALQVVAMYSTTHPDYETQNWHVFLSYLVCTWLCCLTVLFADKHLPLIEAVGGFASGLGFLVTVVVCAVMPTVKGRPHASNRLVWTETTNETGWSSDAFVFCLGMLNAAFAVGGPDIPAHMAEEIPIPTVNIPKAILVQYIFSLSTGFLYLTTLFYAIPDISPLLASKSTFPLAELYQQATSSSAATVSLLVIAFIPTFIGTLGCYVIVGRQFWTLSRDNATPHSAFFSRLSPSWGGIPFNAVVLSGILTTLLGCIYVGSERAFNNLVGSYVVLSTLSYLCAILPHLLTGRKTVEPGWFWMRGVWGFVVNSVSCLYIVVFGVIFCFPGQLPLTAANMNYTCVIVGGVTVFVGLFWLWRRAEYDGPRYRPVKLYEVGGGGDVKSLYATAGQIDSANDIFRKEVSEAVVVANRVSGDEKTR